MAAHKFAFYEPAVQQMRRDLGLSGKTRQPTERMSLSLSLRIFTLQKAALSHQGEAEPVFFLFFLTKARFLYAA
jgi:hypothetical protein